jgi:hypothetical protein
MFRIKPKPPKLDELYVVVQQESGHEECAGKPWARDEAARIFDGVLRTAPAGHFAPGTGNRLRLVSLAEYTRAKREGAQAEYAVAVELTGANA